MIPATDQDVMSELQKDTPLNRARREFSSWSAKIEQAGQQRRPLSSVELRRMEFKAAERIITAYHNPRPLS